MTELLEYSERRGWFLERGRNVMEMPDAVFQRYVEAHLRRLGITAPTQEQRMEARQHCRHASFWDGCADPAIKHWTYGGPQ